MILVGAGLDGVFVAALGGGAGAGAAEAAFPGGGGEFSGEAGDDLEGIDAEGSKSLASKPCSMAAFWAAAATSASWPP